MSSSMSAMSLEDGVMVKMSIEPVFSNKPAAAAGESIEEAMKVVKWIADVDSEIKKMMVFSKEFALSINVLSLLINFMKQEIKSAKFMHKTFLSWKIYLDETELTLQNNQNSKLDTKLVTSIQKHINSQESGGEKTHPLFKDVSAVDPNLKREKEKEITMMPSDLPLSSSFHVENSCSILGLPQQRKTRRSWSKDLHELFLVALKQLGGPQTATPKRIREVMKVNGLTNDEVKSHLQKYRLYSRKNAKASRIVDRSLSLCRGVPREHYATWNHTASRSPESPLEFEKVDDELCSTEELEDSGKDVRSRALTFPVKWT